MVKKQKFNQKVTSGEEGSWGGTLGFVLVLVCLIIGFKGNSLRDDLSNETVNCN